LCFTIFSVWKDFDRDKVSRDILSCDRPSLLTKLQLNTFAPAGPPDAQCSFVCTSESCKWAQGRSCRTGQVSWASCNVSSSALRLIQSLCRFQDGALPGTYFGPNDQCAESIEIQFQIGTDDQLVEITFPVESFSTSSIVTYLCTCICWSQGIHVPVGSSLLQAAELSGAVKPNRYAKLQACRAWLVLSAMSKYFCVMQRLLF